MKIVSYQDNMPEFLFTSHSQTCRLQQANGKAQIQNNNTPGRYCNSYHIFPCAGMDKTCKSEKLPAIAYAILRRTGTDMDSCFAHQREDAPRQDHQLYHTFFESANQ